jgi:hypothetical protein
MSQEWLLPHDPELLYLRERVQRLEAELERYRGLPPEDYSILRHPPTSAVRAVGGIMPPSYRLATLVPLAEAQAENEPGQNRYHIILRGGSGDNSVGYGYYVTHRELYDVRDVCGLMAHLHERTVHALAKFIERRNDERARNAAGRPD